jgi:hypothetical protein
MGEGFIVRKGGGGVERTATPDINFVSKTTSEIVVTFKNNDANQANVFYGLTSPLTTIVTLATNTTSSNITFSGLDSNTQYTISAYAIVADATLKKIKSEIVSTSITTDEFIYTAATGGTTLEYDSGGKRYKSHTFTSNGDFEVTTVGNEDRNQVDYLIIAGGGSGSAGGRFNDRPGGGGGAGGYRTTNGTSGANSSALSKVTVTATSYSITIGAGGASIVGNSGDTPFRGINGTSSSAFSITSTGGGGGGASGQPGTEGKDGLSGGSGGGGGSDTGLGAAGTANQGFGGGGGKTAAGGGGGGAGAVGAIAPGSSIGGNGGAGLANLLRTGSNETRAAGGNGGTNSNSARTDGGVNTGEGGSGTIRSVTSGSGGSGIVVIRYEIPTV